MKPSQIEKLPCLHEENNMFGMFRIKTCHMSDEKIVGLLPGEVSYPVKEKQMWLHNYHLLIIEGPSFPRRKRIPWFIQISLPARTRSDLFIRRSKELVEELYIEPKEQVIVGCFLQINNDTSILILICLLDVKEKTPPIKAT